MDNVKISQITALTPPDAADLVPVTDASASQTKRTTVGEIVGIISGVRTVISEILMLAITDASINLY